MSDDVLTRENIELGASLDSQEETIRRAGELLVGNGYVEDKYIDSMFEREKSVSTFMGNAVAIPHGTSDSKQWIEKSGLSIITVPDGVEYGDGNIAQVCSDEENVAKIVQAESKEELLAFFEDVV